MPAAAPLPPLKVRQKRPHAPKRKTDLGNFYGTFGSLQNCHAYFSLAPYGGLFYLSKISTIQSSSWQLLNWSYLDKISAFVDFEWCLTWSGMENNT